MASTTSQDTQPAPPPSKSNLVNLSLPRDHNLLKQRIVPRPKDEDLKLIIPDFDPLPKISVTGETDPSKILLGIPTKNVGKVSLIQNHVTSSPYAHGKQISTLPIPADSEAGEQPYNSAGLLGAHIRIRNCLAKLTPSDYRGFEVIMVAAVENFIWLDADRKKGVDYGVVMFYNAVTGALRTGISKGVEVPEAYLEEAQRYGFEDEEDGKGKKEKEKGKVTVGEVIAANTGLDKADWHLSLAGVSRYDLLREEMEGMEIPW
ncbi:hypothetical protein QBC35DRAFT_481009 [Podospora australis]|uniref:Uncharacterized protein n=1 Tax=Podospora australis TaxID=1536484 RepID=A0AAN6X373_9PEZI|nr:hypothetical protein QBC35DRAFT_481009 [Podospora australis]